MHHQLKEVVRGSAQADDATTASQRSQISPTLGRQAELLYHLVRTIPAGRVTSYGRLARVMGISPRLVGWLLHRNPTPERTPCHRVVRVDGALASGYAFGGAAAQRCRLEREGVVFVGRRVAAACLIEIKTGD